jgi:hypothetical protein
MPATSPVSGTVPVARLIAYCDILAPFRGPAGAARKIYSALTGINE